jgi:tetratricopeptide repeat protein
MWAQHSTTSPKLYRAQGRYADTKPPLKRALVIDEKSYGPEHPKVAIRLNNLAQLLKNTNRLAEAEPLDRRAQAIRAARSDFG